jgi:type IV pilus assembly protein PilB
MSTVRKFDPIAPEPDQRSDRLELTRGARVPGLRLGDILLNRGLITEEQLHEVLHRQRSSGDRIGTCLLQLGLIDEETLAQTLSEQYKVPYVNLEQVDPDPDTVVLIPKKLSLQCQALPLSRTGASLLVAMLDPSNLSAIDELKFASGLEVQVFVAPESQIRHATQRFYDESHPVGTDADKTGPGAVGGEFYDRLLDSELAGSTVEVIDEGAEAVDVNALETLSGEDRVVDLANLILIDAVRRHASDIHLEPFDRQFRLRFRTDGQLVTVMSLPVTIKDALTSRLKIMAHLNIAERRVPQDGRIRLNVRLGDGVKEMDFRVSTLPTLFGEKIVMRLLDKGNLMFDMANLGFDEHSLEKFETAIHKPYGLILVTGPTGSGKTNTLYSAISQLNQPDVKTS